MAKRNYNKSFKGMRVIGDEERVIGLIWEDEGINNIALNLYSKEYGNYICENIMLVPADSILIGKRKEEGLICLKKIARHKNPLHDVFISEGLYKEIIKYYKQKRKLEKVIS